LHIGILLARRGPTVWIRDIVPACTPQYPIGARRGEGEAPREVPAKYPKGEG